MFRRSFLRLFAGVPLLPRALNVRAIPAIPAVAPVVRRVTVRTGLPAVAWRKLNEGVSPTKSMVSMVEVLNEPNEILNDLFVESK